MAQGIRLSWIIGEIILDYLNGYHVSTGSLQGEAEEERQREVMVEAAEVGVIELLAWRYWRGQKPRNAGSL